MISAINQRRRPLKSHYSFPPNVRNIHLDISFYVIHTVLNTNLTKDHASHPFHEILSPKKSSRFTLKVNRDKLDELFRHEDSCGTEQQSRCSGTARSNARAPLTFMKRWLERSHAIGSRSWK